MRHIKTFLLIIAIASLESSIFATTWNEPWHDKVVKEADYFVLAKVDSFDLEHGVSIDIIKSIGGNPLNGKIRITDFYLLELCSSSGHGPEFHFQGIEECYFFLKKNAKGNYCLATPTSGFANLIDSNVYATYRHSYHQSLVPVDVYEKTMLAIFNNYHNLPYDTLYITDYVKKYVSQKPAGLNENELKTFFAQHVALECAYHLRLVGYYSNLLPFLADSLNFHNQISAARALISYNTAECKQELLNSVNDPNKSTFVQVICIWTLVELKPVEYKDELKKLIKKASTEENGFGGNIMDPRVCTHIPDVKFALEELMNSL